MEQVIDLQKIYMGAEGQIYNESNSTFDLVYNDIDFRLWQVLLFSNDLVYKDIDFRLWQVLLFSNLVYEATYDETT